MEGQQAERKIKTALRIWKLPCPPSFDNNYTSFEHLQEKDFKKIFKHYKRQRPLPSLTDVLQPRNSNDKLYRIPLSTEKHSNSPWISCLGLRPLDQWNCVTLEDHEGLYILTDIIEESQHLGWFDRCLNVYSEPPGLTNVHLHDPAARNIFQNYRGKLRWTTLGIHYDWDTKIYADEGEPLPLELISFGNLISQVLGLGEFHPDAAIINFFPLKGTLGPHIDHSERDLNNPLISLSLGQGAVYLTGGTDLNSPIVPLFLQSGDVLIMHSTQRLVYHAVPSIKVCRNFELIKSIIPDVRDYANDHRISLTLRRVNSPQENVCFGH